MTTRDEIALQIMCAWIARGCSPGEGESMPEIGYRDADMFIAEMLKQQKGRAFLKNLDTNVVVKNKNVGLSFGEQEL